MPSRPAASAPRPSTQPGNVRYPSAKPMPGVGGGNRPSALPSGPGAGNRPSTLPSPRPGIGSDRPNVGGERPSTLPSPRPGIGNGRPSNPGIGSGRPSSPGISTLPADRPSRPGNNTRPPQRPSFDRPSQLPSNRPGIADRPGAATRPGGGDWWAAGAAGGGAALGGALAGRGDVNIGEINIDKNFERNMNWSTNRENWGYNPWWNRSAAHGWYGGCWNHGWHGGYYGGHYHGWGAYRPPGYYWDDDDWGEALGWGLIGWGLGALCFSSGYNDYENPYPAAPVQTNYSAPVTYTQPITIVATETVPVAPDAAAQEGADKQVQQMAEKASTHIEKSQEAFRQGNYVAALESANAAVAESPGDGALHEYRALVLFALGKFSEAAGVLNPVLAGGPGWDWTTMVKLYDSQETYTKQLAALEQYTASKTEAADARFLLGYHYMVCGHVGEAASQFRFASELQPKDTISRQLYNLCAVTSTPAPAGPAGTAEGSAAATETASQAAGESAERPLPEALATPPITPETVPVEKLTGKWVVDKGEKGVVTLTILDDGKFTWDFTKAGKSDGFGGEFSMNDDGLLVLDAEETQMVATIALPEEKTLQFVIAGGPPGDPGLKFTKAG